MFLNCLPSEIHMSLGVGSRGSSVMLTNSAVNCSDCYWVMPTVLASSMITRWLNPVVSNWNPIILWKDKKSNADNWWTEIIRVLSFLQFLVLLSNYFPWNFSKGEILAITVLSFSYQNYNGVRSLISKFLIYT